MTIITFDDNNKKFWFFPSTSSWSLKFKQGKISHELQIMLADSYVLDFYIFVFFHFNTFKQLCSILKSLFWEKQKGVEAAESSKNSIT